MIALALSWPADAYAQGRGGGRGGARRGGRARSVVVVGGAYYRPLFLDPWYGWGYPYGWYPPYAYAGAYDRSASLRLQVEPKQTEVFIDGHFAGTVDDFDGVFQRLHVEPGEHDLELYLPGHRSVRQKIYVQPSATFRVKHTMEPAAAGAVPDPRPAEIAVRPPQQRNDAYGAVAIRVQPDGADVFVW